jgi:hypothetical protein
LRTGLTPLIGVKNRVDPAENQHYALAKAEKTPSARIVKTASTSEHSTKV